MISILIIGNEILSAQVKDFNLGYMLPRLAKAGYPVDEVRIIRDELPIIVDAIRELSQTSSFLISTGGIGPTHDDLTLKAYAQAFDVPLEPHAAMTKNIRDHFGDKVKPGHLRHAVLPTNTELIPSGNPKWPIIKVANCFVLPGLPEAFLNKFPGVLKALPPLPTWQYAAVMLTCGEANFAETLTRIQQEFPEIEIGSYPNWHRPEYRAKITLKGRDKTILSQVYIRVLDMAKDLDSLAGSTTPQPYDPENHGDSFEETQEDG